MIADAFSSRLTRLPRIFDAQAAQRAARDFVDLAPEVRALLAATASCSPYLAGLMAQQGEWLRPTLADTPEAGLAAAIAHAGRPDRGSGTAGEDESLGNDDSSERLGIRLRIAKARVALLVALCDLGGVWSLEEVTGALGRFADAAVSLGLRSLLAEEIAHGRLPGARPGDEATGAGLFILAMGKLGAGELNFSSDIDLISLFDQERYGKDWPQAQTAFVRVTRRLAALLSSVTDHGYVFRCDLRLRPDASATQVCLPMAGAYAYYEAEGRTWERAAHIKARPCAGDLAAAARHLASLSPFVWRRHLDFAAIEDAHAIRLRIRSHRNLPGGSTLEGRDLKLGPGGIREIEFFTQTRQLIAGGRDPSLRKAATTDALDALARRGWVEDAAAHDLVTAYRALREVEHRLQMVNDARTHALPANPDELARIAAFRGQDVAAFRDALGAQLTRVEALTEGFFAHPGGAIAIPAATGAALDESSRAIMERWRHYPCLRSERARRSFRRIEPQITARLAGAANPAEALATLDTFLAGLPAGAQLFALFEANPALIDLIVDIAGTAPALARYLARHPAVLDAVIGGDFFTPWPARPALQATLAQTIARAGETTGDYERRLDAARRAMKEWHFRIGVHHLRGLIDSFETASQYADLAEAVLASLWPVVVADFATRHGPMPGRGAILVGMGSIAARTMHARSDLDLILLYDAEGAEESRGPRPLAASVYFARLARAMVAALAARTAEGRLYEVDMRLRPSGRQGPIAVSLAGWHEYQRNEAWGWEHLALTRARAVAGDAPLAATFETLRRELIRDKGKAPRLRREVAEMRARLFAANPSLARWEARHGAGRLADIELAAAGAALVAGSHERRTERQIAAASGILGAPEAHDLAAAWRFLWCLHCPSRLVLPGDADRMEPERLGVGGRNLLLRESGCADDVALSERLSSHVERASAIIARQYPPQSEEP